MILATLEVDVNFNCNVVVGSDGIITGAQGGHPDTAAGAKCSIVIITAGTGKNPGSLYGSHDRDRHRASPLCGGDDYGIAINPRRQDLIDCWKDVDLPFKTIEELRDTAYRITGVPEKVQFGERVVGIIESRDGTIMDVVRQVKPFTFTE